MKYGNIREEELKNKVEQDFFGKFDCTEIIKNIDFAVKAPLNPPEGGKNSPPSGELEGAYLLWAEAKQKSADIIAMLAQLVLTIGKARTFDEILPPPFLGCYDNEKIAFVPYSEVQDIFYQNDFNWKVAPSDHETREFKQIYAQIQKIINAAPWQTYIFDFEKDEKELKRFIRENFVVGKMETSLIQIDKNNFITIYNKWLEAVKPTIVADWDLAKKAGIIDGDFYLADLLSIENETIGEKLHVLLKTKYYELGKTKLETGFFAINRADFKDNQKAHTQFWSRYKRPPKEEYWNYIADRRDLIVPQDIRERKGSFYTPGIWVELSQKYIADVLGEDWQDEYYVWDCAAGTGNLLAGLTNKYNIWASTLDKQDVDVMKYRIQNGANLLKSHVFQFDFLNDDFSKLPQGLQDIVNDPKRRKKLIIYINPPYAETMSYGEKHKAGLNQSMVNNKYISKMGNCANRELYIQFLMRIFYEIPTCKIANFSTLKNLQSPHFSNFRANFRAKLEKVFLVPANTFDNVKGRFPIGFFIWDTEKQEKYEQTVADIYLKINNQSIADGQKTIHCYDKDKFINEWLISTRNRKSEKNIGFIACLGNDFQQNNVVFIINDKKQMASPRGNWITDKNLIEVVIYFAVRKCIKATWLNNRDQFLYPNDGWQTDTEFQNDCLAYTLFTNNISSKYGTNHWIPFTEYAVGACNNFDSNFMTDFIEGKTKENNVIAEPTLFYGFFSGKDSGGGSNYKSQVRTFSETAKNVFKAGKELWKYYHATISSSLGEAGGDGAVNASLYDIREHFQGRNDKGTMNNKSDDEKYNELVENLRIALKVLAKKIEPKVYEYGFLKK